MTGELLPAPHKTLESDCAQCGAELSWKGIILPLFARDHYFVIAVSPTSVIAVKCLLVTVPLLLTFGLRSL